MKQFDVHIGNITTLEVDVIVNAASRSLRGGGGVDGAIRWAAGPQLDEECLKLGVCNYFVRDTISKRVQEFNKTISPLIT
jgi:O-acetyl-ADP-ribose deacetylase (regulator of RNase III)